MATNKSDGGQTHGAGAEKLIQDLDNKIERLKIEFTLFFSGEERVPPEKERQDLEKSIRILVFSETKSARVNMLAQNLAAKFALYNNMWLKKLNEMETGVQVKTTKPLIPPSQPAEPAKAEKIERETSVKLNDEKSFEHFVREYRQLLPKETEIDGEKIIRALKSKLIKHDLKHARISMTAQNGKLNIKIKSEG